MPIVSLFEHQKLTAAICNCLKSGNKFIVLRYKLKNIGNFIYQDFESIKTKSLLVQLIQEYIAFFFINYFNLTYENLIYSLGGEGRLLLPYCKKNKLSKLANIIVNLVNSIFNGIINIVLTYDIYNEKTLIYNYFKNEKILKIKKQKINHNIDINQLLLDSILKNEKFIIEYNFTNSKENAIVDLGRFGSINLYSKINEKSYYASYNNYLLGEVKYYPILNNLKTKENLVFVLMDIDNLENIIKTHINTISKFNMISNALELFFGKHVFEICKDKEVYLIYSGGDDITFISQENKAQEIIDEIVKSLDKYTNSAIQINYQIEVFNKENINKVYCKAKEKLKEVSNNE